MFNKFETVVMKCPFKSELFPFDMQTCELIYRSDLYGAEYIAVQLIGNGNATIGDFAPSSDNYQEHSGNI